MSRLEYLLSLINLQSSTRPPVEVATTVARWTRQDALAELSYLLQGRERYPVLCALLRHAPELVSDAERSELRKRLCDELVIYAHTLRRPVSSDRLPEMLHKIAVCCVVELVEWEPCRTCHGKGRVSVMKDDGAGVVEEICPKCKGARRLPWSDRRRARALGLSLSTAQNRWLDLLEFGISRLEGWANEGVSAIQHDMLRRR
jgi:hypothetical protein